MTTPLVQGNYLNRGTAYFERYTGRYESSAYALVVLVSREPDPGSPVGVIKISIQPLTSLGLRANFLPSEGVSRNVPSSATTGYSPLARARLVGGRSIPLQPYEF